MAEVTAFVPVESEITQSLPYGSSAVSSRIHEMFWDFSQVDSKITVAQQLFTISQTVRALVDGRSQVASPIVGSINTDSPPWTVGKTGVNSLIRATIDFGFKELNGTLDEYNHVDGLFATFCRIDHDGGGGGGGVLPPIDPGVDIPAGRAQEAGIDYAVFLDGEDLTKYVSSCRISYSREKFCGEVDISWSTSDLFTKLNCLPLSPSPRILVQVLHYTDSWNDDGVKTRAINSTTSFSFFLEKRDTSLLFGAHSVSSWGRSLSAKLAAPYSKKYVENLQILSESIESGEMVKVVDIFSAICEDAGLAAVDYSWEIHEYEIRPGKFSVVGMYPIEAIQRLAEAVGGIIVTDRLDINPGNPKTIRAVYKYPM